MSPGKLNGPWLNLKLPCQQTLLYIVMGIELVNVAQWGWCTWRVKKGTVFW